ncbi:hypothetical protein H6768_06890 [Candidatus Peribacteria bacterium]|nr:hypothetical protein [Candidatus Peribacteria bacterium]
MLKKRVRGLLDGQFDHSTLISPKSIAILEEFKSRGMKVVETTSGSISGLPILIFDTVLRAHL